MELAGTPWEVVVTVGELYCAVGSCYAVTAAD